MSVNRSPILHSLSPPPRFSSSFHSYSIIPTTLALLTSLFIIFYISLTSKLFRHPVHSPVLTNLPLAPPNPRLPSQSVPAKKPSPFGQNRRHPVELSSIRSNLTDAFSLGSSISTEVFHDEDFFLENYKEMNQSFKIYVYPLDKSDPFANVFLPVDFEPGGNYASESYFKKVLLESHFITNDPSEADLFFVPFSIARLRHDPRVGVGGIQNFIRTYFSNIIENYPYWNRSGGADHFYVACHSIGRSAMEKVLEATFNAIQVVCSSSYFLSGYIAHKDASLPQIWPRQGQPPNVGPAERNKLAFFAGSMNSPVREKLIQTWKDDSEIAVYFGRLNTSYTDELLHSKFCLHVKGFEVNTARIGDALYYGCVPVIIANHYDLPFNDILNWKSFSLVVATLDIPQLKKILHQISSDEFAILQKNVLKVQKHFQWHLFPVDYDAFYMVMYELWLRRTVVRIPLSGSPSNSHQRERNISKCI